MVAITQNSSRELGLGQQIECFAWDWCSIFVWAPQLVSTHPLNTVIASAVGFSVASIAMAIFGFCEGIPASHLADWSFSRSWATDTPKVISEIAAAVTYIALGVLMKDQGFDLMYAVVAKYSLKFSAIQANIENPLFKDLLPVVAFVAYCTLCGVFAPQVVMHSVVSFGVGHVVRFGLKYLGASDVNSGRAYYVSHIAYGVFLASGILK